jgi:TRAP-type C4-dicarboxylate transport system permease small subunit
MELIDAALSRLARLLSGLGVLIVILMTVHIVADVTSRFFFNYPLAGTLEIVANYYMVGLIFLPLAVVQRNNGHIAADFLSGLITGRFRYFLDAFLALSMAVFAATIVWRTGVEALRSVDTLEAVQTSGYFVYIFPARWFIPIGVSVMGLCALVQCARNLVSAMRSRGSSHA